MPGGKLVLSLILIVLGLSFNRLAYGEKQAVILASLLAASTVLFPLGVLLQIGPAAGVGKLLSTAGAVGVIIGLLLTVYGLLKRPPAP